MTQSFWQRSFLILAVSLSFGLSMALIGCTSSSAPTVVDGTGDSGGGNLYKGKPLESYIKKPLDLEAYQTFIQPLRRSFERTMVESTLRGVLENKTWYFVPGPLDHLPGEKIGSAVPTDQVALQDFNSVWIDTDLFNAMTIEDQAKILMHEMLMGAKLLRLDSYWHSCWVRSFGHREFEGCEGASKSARGRPSDLSPEDYTQIRRTTAEIFESHPGMSAEEWEELLGQGEFDDPPSIVFRVKEETRELSLEGLKRWLRESELLGYAVTHGFDTEQLLIQNPTLPNIGSEDIFWSSHESCGARIEIEGPNLSVHLKMGAKEIAFNHRMHSEKLTLRKGDRYGEMVWETLIVNSDTSNKKQGDPIYLLDLAFSGESRLDSVEVTQGVCLDNGCSSRRNPKNGLNYICSVRDIFKYN